MSFLILIPKKVDKEIASLPNPVVENIIAHLKILEENPLVHGSKKLKNRDGYRLRVGEYRIIYEVELNKRVVSILRIAHRKDVYKR